MNRISTFRAALVALSMVAFGGAALAQSPAPSSTTPSGSFSMDVISPRARNARNAAWIWPSSSCRSGSLSMAPRKSS